MDRRERAELRRILDADRRRAERELDELRKRSDAEISSIRREAERHERALMDEVANLERRQREALRRKEQEMADALRRQAEEARREIARLRAEAQNRIREASERMREAWELATRELNDRIDSIIAHDREALENQRVSAEQALNRARSAIQSIQTDSNVLRFNGYMISGLASLFNSAAREYNAGRYNQAYAQAVLASAQCASCVADAGNQQRNWMRNSADAFRMLQHCRKALSAMDDPMDIEAADYVRGDVRLRIWNQEDWTDISAELDRIESGLNAPEPCTGDEIAKYLCLLDGIQHKIPQAIQTARASVVRFLYITYLLDYLSDTLCDWMEGWIPLALQTEAVVNTGYAELGPRGSAQRIRLRLTEAPEDDAILLFIENDSYDSEEKRMALLNRLREAFALFNGTDELLLEIAGGSLYREDSALCMRLALRIPGAALKPLSDERIDARFEKADESIVNTTPKPREAKRERTGG